MGFVRGRIRGKIPPTLPRNVLKFSGTCRSGIPMTLNELGGGVGIVRDWFLWALPRIMLKGAQLFHYQRGKGGVGLGRKVKA